MRVVPFVIASLCFALAGCGSVPEESSIADEELISTSVSASAVGGACTTSCDCPLDSTCSSGVCVILPVAGPRSPNPRCYADCQCSSPQYCSATPPSHGYCEPSCSVKWLREIVPPGQGTLFIIRSNGLPAGSYSRLYGTKDGVTDVNGQIWQTTSGSYGVTYGPGVYTRYMKMFSAANVQLCQTNVSSVTFQ